jgi:hypothetical protein
VKRHSVSIAGTTHYLAQGHEVDDVKRDVVAAARAGGDLVDFVVYGNAEISVLVTPGVPIVFSSEEVGEDPRDDGDVDQRFHPFGSMEAFESFA